MPVVILSAHISLKTSEPLLIMPNSYIEIYRVPIAKGNSTSVSSVNYTTPKPQ